MDIFLVRHGEAAASWGESPDPGLSELGVTQAERAGETLHTLLPETAKIVSSPLQRAQDTAAPLARQRGLPVAIDAVFREVPSPVPLAQRQDWLRQFMQQQWHEQGADLCAWRDAAYQSVLNLDAPSAVFTHFLVINAIVGVIENYPATLRFWPDNGSITRLRKEAGRLRLVELGEEIHTRVN